MIAAIYARKSTEQAVADEQKSVNRQIEHARQYAARKGWTVADAHVYVDDGISGAEFANRPGFLRLMNALKPRPAFQVLVMSEDSRLGREAVETAYALKQIITAGVRVFLGGHHSHVEREIIEAEADIVRRMFTLSAEGNGLKAIAKQLKAERAPSPRAQQRPHRDWTLLRLQAECVNPKRGRACASARIRARTWRQYTSTYLEAATTTHTPSVA